MADFMSAESIFKFKNAFAAFESKNTGLIKVKQLGGVMRWVSNKKCENILLKYFLGFLDKIPARLNYK